jgi:hypothetical protein
MRDVIEWAAVVVAAAAGVWGALSLQAAGWVLG